MGLHLCYELGLPDAIPETDAAARLTRLQERALTLPFEHVSEVVRLTQKELSGGWPLRGLTYERLEDVALVSAQSARAELYRRSLDISEDDGYSCVDVPPDVATVALGFAVAPGQGCEPATFGVARIIGADHASSRWWWHRCCKTQYASILGDAHLLRCHGSLVTLLDAAGLLDFEVTVRDETGTGARATRGSWRQLSRA